MIEGNDILHTLLRFAFAFTVSSSFFLFFRPVEIYDCSLLRDGCGGGDGGGGGGDGGGGGGSSGFIFLSGAKSQKVLACDFVDRDIDRSLGILRGGRELKPGEFQWRRHAKNDLDNAET